MDHGVATLDSSSFAKFVLNPDEESYRSGITQKGEDCAFT